MIKYDKIKTYILSNPILSNVSWKCCKLYWDNHLLNDIWFGSFSWSLISSKKLSPIWFDVDGNNCNGGFDGKLPESLGFRRLNFNGFDFECDIEIDCFCDGFCNGFGITFCPGVWIND